MKEREEAKRMLAEKGRDGSPSRLLPGLPLVTGEEIISDWLPWTLAGTGTLTQDTNHHTGAEAGAVRRGLKPSDFLRNLWREPWAACLLGRPMRSRLEVVVDRAVLGLKTLKVAVGRCWPDWSSGWSG